MKNFFPASESSVVLEKIACKYSPEEVFSLFSDHENLAFLNSSMSTDAARYSFIGIEPFFAMRSKGSLIDLELSGQKMKAFGSPLKVLKSALTAYKVNNETDFPFTAGGIGFFSYEAKNLIEDLPFPAVDDTKIPDVSFVFYRGILIFDRMSPGSFTASVLDLPSSGQKSPGEIISGIEKVVKRSPRLDGRAFKRKHENITSNFSKREYVAAVEKILGHIREGDIYQACLSQRFSSFWEYPGYDLYLKLNNVNPSPFSAYINSGGISVISSSPELFLRRRGDVIETRPMKGTRPAGNSSSADEAIKAELAASEKDISELLMIVDLERNDIGKIAVPGSVIVEESRRIERYPTVFQAISVIKGKVKPGVDNMDILEAAFPGGSITGCPKIRAIEIINETEKYARGVYTGAIGYLSFHDTMDLNIAIRTITLKGKRLYFHSGGGIVAESDPESEYEETIVKAKALMRAIGAKP
jgi:para-aminobenzoate synthetase component I